MNLTNGAPRFSYEQTEITKQEKVNAKELLNRFLYAPPEAWQDLISLCVELCKQMDPPPVIAWQSADIREMIPQGGNLVLQWPHYSIMESVITLAAMYQEAWVQKGNISPEDLADMEGFHRLSLVRKDPSFPLSSLPVDISWQETWKVLLTSPTLFEKLSAVINWYECLTSGKHAFDPVVRHQHNSETIAQAAEYLQQGENIFFYPGGPYMSQGFKVGAARIFLELLQKCSGVDELLAKKLLFVHGFTPTLHLYQSIVDNATVPSIVYFTHAPSVQELLDKVSKKFGYSYEQLLELNLSDYKTNGTLFRFLTTELEQYFAAQKEEFLYILRTNLINCIPNDMDRVERIVATQRRYYEDFLESKQNPEP